MEKIIQFLIGLCITCAILVVLLLIAIWIYSSKMKNNAKNLLKSTERGADFIYRLLRTAFPQGRIIRQASLPLGDGRRVLTDLLLVDRGGVFIIRVKSFPGAIDNTSRSTWTVTNTKGVGEFPNPFEQNRYVVSSIEAILKKEKIYNVPTHNIVVFSQKRVAFKLHYDKLLTAERLIDCIKDLNRNRFLNQKEINLTLTAIKKYLPKQL